MLSILKFQDKSDYKKLFVFIIFAYLISWVIALPLVLNQILKTDLPVFEYQHFLVAFGPFLSAILTTLIFEKFDGVKKLFKTLFTFKLNPFIYIFVVLTPLLLFVLSVVIDFFVSGKFLDFSQIGITSEINSTNILLIAFVWIFSYGLGEEGGWRGFLLPILNKTNSAYKSSLIISVIWMLWHLPFFFYNSNFMAMGWMVIGWGLGLVFGSVLLSFISVNSKYSIVAVLIWHGIFDIFTSSNIAGGMIASVMSMGVIAIAIFLHVNFGNSLIVKK